MIATRLSVALQLGLGVLLLTCGAALAGDLDAASEKTLHDYVLTMPKVRAYEAAHVALMAAAAHDATLKADYEAAGAEQTKTMADEVAKMTHHPRTYAFFAKQGLSKDDAIILPMALMGGCMVVQYPEAAKGLAAQTSPQQAIFCKQNKADLSKMTFFKG